MLHRVLSLGKSSSALSIVVVTGFFAIVVSQSNLSLAAELPDPLFYVSFDGTGNANISGGSAAGELEGGAFVAGKVAQGILFEGEERCTYSTADNLNNLKGTVMMWVKPEWKAADKKGSHFFFGVLSDGWADNNMVFVQAAGGLNEAVWMPFPFPAFFVYMRGWWGELRDKGGVETKGRVIEDASAWQAGEWHHIAHTWDLEKGQYLYIDGELVDATETAAPSGVSNVGADMYIGSLPADNSSKQVTYVDCTGPDAVIDEFYIYGEMLTAEQIMDCCSLITAVNPNGMLAITWGDLKKRMSNSASCTNITIR